MRGFLYLLLLCFFCFGFSPGTATRNSQYPSSRTPSATATQSPATDSAAWRAYDDPVHGLRLHFPPDWQFFGAAQDAAFQEETASAGSAETAKLLAALRSGAQPDSFIGVGYALPQGPLAYLHVNSVVVEIVPARGRTLFQFGHRAAAALGRRDGLDVDSVDLVTGLRPRREAAFSIRYRGGVPAPASPQSVLTGSRTAGWQVVLISPDGEFLAVLTFSALGEQFDALEPLLMEMVRRMEWAGDGREPGSAAGRVTVTNRTMYVRSEPARSSPVIGKVVAGGRFSIVDRDFTGNWWRISYGGQPGWVSDPLLSANIPNVPESVPVAMIDRRVNIRSGPGAGNPIIGVAIAGAQYLITGKNEEGNWWQIDNNGRVGWVFGELVTAVEAGGVQRVVVEFSLPPLLPVTVAMMTANLGMNVRGGPHNSYPIVGTAEPGHPYPIIGKSAAGDWWRIEYDGQSGWVHGGLVRAVNAGSVEVVARFPLPPLLPATEAVLTFSRRMNVYGGPGGRYSVIGTIEPGFQYPITGRNEVGTWWQIDNRGQAGWVFGQFAPTVGGKEDE